MAAATTTPGYRQVYSGGAAAARRHGSGSVGPFLAVLPAVLVLAVLSCVVGRVYCAAKAEGPDERYDCAWRWRGRAPRRAVRAPDEVVKQPAALPLPEP